MSLEHSFFWLQNGSGPITQTCNFKIEFEEDDVMEVTLASGNVTPYSRTWFNEITQVNGSWYLNTPYTTLYKVLTSGQYENQYYYWDGTQYTLTNITDISERILNNDADLSLVDIIEISYTDKSTGVVKNFPMTVSEYNLAIDSNGNYNFPLDTKNRFAIIYLNSNTIPSNLMSKSTAVSAIFTNGVNIIGSGAFSSCQKLESLYFPRPIVVSDYAFDNCYNIMNLTLYSSNFTYASNSFDLINNEYGPEFCRLHCTRTLRKELLNDANFSTLLSLFIPVPTQENYDDYKFTVASGRQVVFSYGNLQYRGSQNLFTCAPYQYSSIRNTGGNLTTPRNRKTQTSMIDLYNWATSGGYYSGYHYHYKPYDCIYYNNSNYAYYHGIVLGSQSYSYNITGTGADWGIAIGGKFKNQGNWNTNTWRILTADEWNYLYATRPNATSLRARATVNGVYGMILLPDNWVLPQGYSITVNTSYWSTNKYTATEWIDLEDAGALFLPVVGYRTSLTGSQSTTDADTYTGSASLSGGDFDRTGSYWSSTYTGTNAYRFYFAETSVTTRSSVARHNAYGVRLVRDA